jgi:Intracellular multiplication and human macrophage-killing
MKAPVDAKALSKLPRPENGLLFLVLAVVLLVGIGALVWYWRRRKAKAEVDAVEVAVAPPVDTSLGDEVAEAWRGFRRGLPGRARRSLQEFQPVIVLGTESSGKTEIIERFSGVAQRRAEIGAPAEVLDAGLRLHLGSDCLVAELSEEVCRARMDTVDAGLRKVFGEMLRLRTPIVVVTLSPETLEKRSELELRELGAAIRAKIELFAELRGEPLEVRLVLPELPGAASSLPALFLLARLPGVAQVFPLGQGEEPAIRAQLLALTDLFSAALIAHGPEETLAVVELLESVPKLSQAIASLANELLQEGEAAAGVRDGGLYLVPLPGGRNPPNPLQIPQSLLRPQPHPLLKHRLITVSAGVAMVAWLAGGYAHHAKLWRHASLAAGSYEVGRHDEEHMRKLVRDYARGDAGGSVLGTLLPRYFTRGPRIAGCAFVERIRQHTLRDELSDAICRSASKPPAEIAPKCTQRAGQEKMPATPEEMLYLLALLYASNDNDLQTIVRHGREQFAAVTLTVPIIDDYLDLAGPNRDVELLEMLWSYEFEGSHREELARTMAFLEPLTRASAGLAHPSALVDKGLEVRGILRDRGRFGHAAAVLDSRAFDGKPLSNYAKLFTRHRERLELLSELAERRADLEKVVDAVTGGVDAKAGEGLGDVPALVKRLETVLGEKHDTSTVAFELGGSAIKVQLGAVTKALRDARLRAIVEAFGEQAEENELVLLGFQAVDQRATMALRARWPEGIAGEASLPRPYTREGFEKAVKPNLVALDKLLAEMTDLGPTHAQVKRLVGAAIARYAADYVAAIDAVYGGVKLGPVSTVGLKRVLRSLAGGGSALHDFLGEIAHHTSLGVEKLEVELLDPMLDVEVKYGPVARIVDPSKPGGPLVSYQDILRDAVLRLEPGAGAGVAETSAFAARLAPLGRLAFAAMADPKTAPVEAVRTWAQAQQLDDELGRPFLAPVERLAAQAGEDLSKSLQHFNRELVHNLEVELTSRFPFSAQAEDEVNPEDLDQWLNPTRGRIARDVLAGVGPLVRRAAGYEGGQTWAASTNCAADPGCTSGIAPLLGTVNDLARLSALLWSEDGKTQPVRVRILPQPLRVAGNAASKPVAVRLVVGEGRVDYFNQRPAETVLEIDWTKRQTAALSVDVASKDPVKSFEPPAVVVSGSAWSFLRLLQKGHKEGSTRTWRVPTGAEPITISFTVREGLTDAFRFGTGARRPPGLAEN